MRIKVLKLKNGKKLPQRAYKNDTGADVFTTDIEIIPAGKVKRVPLGIAVEIPKGFNAYIANKSGLSTKGLWIANAPIDHGYSGEISAIIINTTKADYKFNAGDKIGQLIVVPCEYPEFIDVKKIFEGKRGGNGFGSTGN